MNMNMKCMATLFSIVILSTVLFTTSGCGQQSYTLTHTILTTPTPSQGDSVSDSTQTDSTPTAIEVATNELSQELLPLKGIVGVGIGRIEGSPCILVYLENDSIDLKSKVPTQFHGFPVVAEVTGPIEALPVETAQAIQLSSGSKVELDIFSGVPNPTWVLSLPEASDLASRISTLNPTKDIAQHPENLGYRGFIVQTIDASSETVQTIRAYHGYIEVVDSTRTTYYVDPQRQIELWLLATAKPTLAEDLTAGIFKEIMNDMP